MYKMLFNTGVKPYNHLNKSGELIKGKHQEFKNGELNIAFYLEQEPPKNYRLDFLCDTIDHINANQIAIPVVDGGMLSKYAIFTIM